SGALSLRPRFSAYWRHPRAILDRPLLDIGEDRLGVLFGQEIGEARHPVVLEHATAHDVLEVLARVLVHAPEIRRDAGAHRHGAVAEGAMLLERNLALAHRRLVGGERRPG